MPEMPPDVTLDEVKERVRLSGLPIPANRLALVRGFLVNALRPIRALDSRAIRTVEPAVTFDAKGGPEPAHERRRALLRGHPGAGRPLPPAGAVPGGLRHRSAPPHRDARQEPERLRHVTAERALADARAAEAALKRGDAGPLTGIPIAYKDLYATKGILTTAGSALLADWVPDFDCTCVTRLQQAGMVMLGKLITHEFAFGIQFPGHRFPPARNPWNLDHIPGGSSSGSGAALAAGMAVGALGSDTGGSIRGPAAFCGIAGLKPTYGRVSRAGVVTLSWTLDHTGPMARSAEDCAFMLQALAGHDPADPASAREPVPDYLATLEGGVKGLRVGVVRDYFFDQVEPETVAAFERAVGELGRLGATVRDVTIPSIHATPSFMVIMLTEAFAYHERDLRLHPELYGDVLREKLMAGGLFRADEYIQAQRLRSQIREDTGARCSRWTC